LRDNDRTGIGSGDLGNQFVGPTRKGERGPIITFGFPISVETDNRDDCVSLFRKGNGRVHQFVGILDFSAAKTNTRVAE
jgi:hypothetical protein